MEESVVRNDLKKSTHELLSVISGFPEEHFNTVPPDGGWSVGQIAEHLIKIESSTVRLFTGDFKVCERDPEEKIQIMKDRFLDLDKKMTAHGPIVPDDSPKDKDKVLDKLQDLRQRLTGMIELHDLSEVITSFAHPLFGLLTRIEWIYFNIYHTQRHLTQIQKILKQVSA
jgi:hypothetical protein